ncbi:hypothetical protein PX414_004322 [Escherichia coli]|uniref:Uncharacterized protein n=2 Tax=Rosemountvirus TaxID=2733127 RepID=A0A140XG43_9CAUD|nr:hypothetical protein BJD50_gp12 [Salmonella phage BP63]EBY8042317.1 hypothetical protein [Salmonella enterica subsp. enterica serovar Agona]EID3231937.1 hypothetical protein [Salmonella enterica]EKN7553696.1 hypothetical protein [Escherichia coli]QGH77713.1 hypothetical protein [Escherichia phage BEC1-17]WNT47301.1 hypothetical protein SPLA11_PHROGS00021 [Salmonella phage SPLA11]WPK38357.1 hypothetical protein [Escherichia phage AV127]
MKDLKLTKKEVELLVEFLDISIFNEKELLEDWKESIENFDPTDQEERVELLTKILNKLK